MTTIKKDICPNEFRLQLQLGGINTAQACTYLQVNRTTAARWFTGESRIPWTAYRCAQIDLAGAMPFAAGPDWEGWIFRNGKLVSPENQVFKMGEIRNIPWQYTITAGLRRELRIALEANEKLKNKMSSIDEIITFPQTA